MKQLLTAGLFSSLAITAAVLAGCSNSSTPDAGTGGSAGSSGGSEDSGGSGGGGPISPGGSGEAGSTDASGGSSATGMAGEAGSSEASGGSSAAGGNGGTSGDTTGGTGGDLTGGTGGTGGDASGGTGGSGGTKGSTPSPKIDCTGSVTSDAKHELTSCGLSVSMIAGAQTMFTLGLQGKDANNDGLTLTLQFTDEPTADTYTFASTDYAAFDSEWSEGTTIYTATAYGGVAGIGDITVEFDTIDGPFTLASTTFYEVTGSIHATLANPPSGSATLDVTF